MLLTLLSAPSPAPGASSSEPFAGQRAPAAAPLAAVPKPITAPAEVVSLGYCEEDGDYYQSGSSGGFRWAAVKGVTAYTVIFNDGAYGGAEQRISVVADPDANPETPPWPNDRPPEGEKYPEWNAPKGTHQVGWTGGAGFGPGTCAGYEPPDYSERLTNAHVEYYRDGEYIDGTIVGPCEDGECPPAAGVKVTAKGPGGGSDTTDSAGQYSIKVKKGTYEVVPKKGDLKFGPKSKKVTVRSNSTAKANFTIAGGPAELSVSVTPKQSPINVSDSPEQSGPAQTFVYVDVKNKGKGTAEAVELSDFKIAWDVEGVKEPEPLPLKQAAPASLTNLGDIAPGETVRSEILVEASGDGDFKLSAEVKGEDFKGPVKARGSGKIKAQSPLLFIYTRPGESVSSPDVPELIKAGTALSVRIRLRNRSYKEYLAVQPILSKMEGNLLGGYTQEAGKPIQNGPQVDDIDLIYNANNFSVLKPREDRVLDAVFRTTYSDPTSAAGGGGTRGKVTFVKPTTSTYDPEKGDLERVGEEDVAFAAGAETIHFSIDDRPPDVPPFGGPYDTAGAFGAFSKGALIGLAYSISGTVKGLFYDLPVLIKTGAQAYVQTVVERQAELWQAVTESKDAREAWENYQDKQREFMLRDFEAIGKVPGAIRNAVESFDKASEKRLNALANDWFAGDWVGAAEQLGQDSGQLVGDVALADVVLAKAAAALPRLAKIAKAAAKTKAEELGQLANKVQTFTAKAQDAVRSINFLKRVKPGFVFDFEALEVLYGITHAQARFLATLSNAEGILIAVRSRGAGAVDWIKKFGAYVKPEWVKTKNVNRYDVDYLGYAASDLDRVAIKTNLPTDAEVIAKMDADNLTDQVTRDAILERLQQRRDELACMDFGCSGWILEKARTGEVVETKFNWKDNGLDPYAKGKTTKAVFSMGGDPPGNLMVSVDGAPPRPITGDLDLVALTKADGTPLSNAVHERVLRILRGPPMFIQHPETSTWIKKGAFDFAAKHSELAKDLPVQFAPDGLARMIKYNRGLSFFQSKLNYFVHWEGGYRHLDWLKMPGLAPATP